MCRYVYLHQEEDSFIDFSLSFLFDFHKGKNEFMGLFKIFSYVVWNSFYVQKLAKMDDFGPYHTIILKLIKYNQI